MAGDRQPCAMALAGFLAGAAFASPWATTPGCGCRLGSARTLLALVPLAALLLAAPCPGGRPWLARSHLLRLDGPLRTLEGLVLAAAEEVDMVEVGDRVLVESEKVGAVTRGGVVTEVDGRLITVRWDSGSSSTFVPSAGCLQVMGQEPQAEGVDGA
jgi:Domain of unknown function (DUF1918)